MATTSVQDLHPDVLTGVLSLLDGTALASTSCSTFPLRSLAGDPSLWRRLCVSVWPSVSNPVLQDFISTLPNTYHSYFSLAFPFPSSSSTSDKIDEIRKPFRSDKFELPTKLTSAVDIFHKNTPIFSRVVETDASSSWFQNSPFRIEALERKDRTLLISTENLLCPRELTLSWVIIDPATKKTVNISSRNPVSIERRWFTGDNLVKFAIPVNGDQCCINVIVACGEETGQVNEVSVTVEDSEGVCMNGKESLLVIKGLMDCLKRGKVIEKEIENSKQKFENYLNMKKALKEKKESKERKLEMLYTGVAFLIFFAFIALFLFR